MKLRLSLGLSPQHGGSGAPPAPDYAAEVAALLSSTIGFALDPSDVSTLFQDTAAATPVASASDPIGRINSKYGTTAYNFQNATGTLKPLWNGAGGMAFDGVDDRLDQGASYTYTAAIAGCVISQRIKVAALAGNFFGISTNSGTNARIQLGIGASGQVILSVRRLDTDGANTFTSANGIIAINTNYTVTARIDYAGTGGIEVWVNGVSILTGTLINPAGNTSNTNQVRHRLGTGQNSGPCNMTFGRYVFLPRLNAAGEIASMEGYVAGVTL